MPTLLALESLQADKRYVEQQLENLEDDVWGTTRMMWEARLADINRQVEALETDISNYASVALFFHGDPVIGSTELRLDFAADALGKYQALVAAAYATRLGEDSALSGPVRGTRSSRLYLRDIARGSFGFVLEEVPEKQAALLPTHLKDAVERTTQMLSVLATGDEQSLNNELEAMRPRFVLAIKNFTSALAVANAGTRIVADRHQAEISVHEANRLTRRLEQQLSNEEAGYFDGVLVGILPGKRLYEFQSLATSPGYVKGSMSVELAERCIADRSFFVSILESTVRAYFRRVSTTITGKQTKEQFILEDVRVISRGDTVDETPDDSE